MLLGSSFIFMNPVFKCDFSDQELTEADACPNLDKCKIGNCSLIFSKRLHSDVLCLTLLWQSNISKLNPINPLHRLNHGSFHHEHVEWHKRKKIQLHNIMGNRQRWNHMYNFNYQVLILGAFKKTIALMAFAQIVTGFGGYATMIISYNIISDMCKDSLRQKVILSLNGFW